MMRRFIEANRRLSRRLDRLLPDHFWLDGNNDFRRAFVPPYLSSGGVIYDIGSGARPFLTIEQKRALGVRVVGFDIDGNELASAPPLYDEVVIADLTDYQGKGDADLVICQSVLEHVADNRKAFKSLSTIVRPGGVVLMFMPNRYAIFALLNRILPEFVKRRLLVAIFPETRQGYGFKAFYDHCTPARLERLGNEVGLTLVGRKLYWHSAYFQFLVPLHVTWRIYMLAIHKLLGPRSAETYSLAFQRQPGESED